MWNLFKKNKEIEFLTAQINELQSRIKEQNRTIEDMTADRDYWKSQYEQLTENFSPNSAELGEEIKKWTAQKMLKNMQDLLQGENLKKRINDNTKPEELTEIFEKITIAKIENIFLHELGEIIIKTTKLD